MTTVRCPVEAPIVETRQAGNRVSFDGTFDEFVRSFHHVGTPESTETFFGTVASLVSPERRGGPPQSTDRAISDVLGRAVAQRKIASLVRSRLTGPVSELDLRPEQPFTRVVVTNRWEGVVTSVEADAGLFAGQFVEIGCTQPKMSAEFLIDEVPEDDRELLRTGSLFYLTAARVRLSEHRWQPTSEIRFRRIPSVRQDDVRDAREYAAKLRRKLGLEP